jgi:cob(I)alamin adenosyltransferase
VSAHALAYLNRLSDALFVMARLDNLRRGRPETPWNTRA